MKDRQCLNKNGKPKLKFGTKKEAKKFASYGRSIHGHEKQIPYWCSQCKCWHLSLLSRHTPSSRSQCSCTDSNGSSKALYQTEDAARLRASIIKEEEGVTLEIYECPDMNGYHLTSG